MNHYYLLIRKSIAAAFLISLGDYALLKLENPIGPVLFALGLLGVCYMNLNLFTGKCGFFIQDKIPTLDLILILLFNLLGGYLLGLFYSYLDVDLFQNALSKVSSWSFSLSFFGKSILCGAIMYIAVYMYRTDTPLGIIFGVPLFIFCGFQHCIANIITLGVARSFDWSILLCVLGNFVGSLAIWYFSKDMKETPHKAKK